MVIYKKEPLKSFVLKEPEIWQQLVVTSPEPYGSCVIRFAARWANLMEQKMANGAKLEDIFKAAGHEANVEFITGEMYGCAASILSEVWEHGEQLLHCHGFEDQK